MAAALSAKASARSGVKVQAFFSKKSSVEVVDKPATTKGKTTKGTAAPKRGEQKDSLLSSFDFAQTRSKKDAELLWDAKYGERGADGKMTREQYQALRRKIGGTAKDFWKDWVEEEQVKNIKTYYKEDAPSGTVPYLPFLIGVVVAMLGTTAAVVAQTSAH